MKSIKNIDLNNKTVLVRVDFNVPLNLNKVSDDSRIKASLETIKYLIEQNSKIVLISHLGRPNGEYDEKLSLKPVKLHLEKLLKNSIKFLNLKNFEETKNQIQEQKNTEITLLENIRFFPEEEKNDDDFAKKLASLGDIFINDAFATSHRSHASTVGISKYLQAYPGLLMEKEIKSLDRFINNNNHPFTVIMGGAKLETKINVIENFANKADSFIFGGGIANTFLYEKGIEIGNSLAERKKSELIEELSRKLKKIHLPIDVIVAKALDSEDSRACSASEVDKNEMILDIGKKSIEKYKNIIKKSKTIIWNGPVGAYENPNFANGTKHIAEAISNAAQKGTEVLIGGGDSVDAINKFNINTQHITHISTGGGAMLEYMEGKKLPGIKALS
ncbi:phosphoglycerate kinase [Candidatus Peregrinibacteria bacterium]|nr:phosphoglycerate kinase [Candidatus Peregrinibacteria bacterium]